MPELCQGPDEGGREGAQPGYGRARSYGLGPEIRGVELVGEQPHHLLKKAQRLLVEKHVSERHFTETMFGLNSYDPFIWQFVNKPELVNHLSVC